MTGSQIPQTVFIVGCLAVAGLAVWKDRTGTAVAVVGAALWYLHEQWKP